MCFYKRPYHFGWKDLKDFAFDDVKKPNLVSSAIWNQPFPYEIPPFPILSRASNAKDDRLLKEPTTRDPFVPNHLPVYPPLHTYKRLQQVSKKRTVGESSLEESTSAGHTKKKKGSNSKSALHSLTLIEDSVDADKVAL